MRLSKSLPRGLVGLDANWPSAPVALTEASNQLREMYRLHLTRKFMRPLTPEDRAQFTLKLAASDLFKGKKQCYPASVPLRFLNTHLSREDMRLKEAHFDSKVPSIGAQKFSLHCVKYDRHGYKARQRVLVVTDKGCHLLEANTFKQKEYIPFQDIQQITVSSLTDGLVVIRLPADGPDGRGDLLVETDRVIEFVIKLALFAEKLQEVQINTTGTMIHHLPKDKSGTITFQTGSIAFTGKGKTTGYLEVVTPPP